MLQFGRIDLWYTDAAIARQLSEKLGFKLLITEVYRVHSSESFLAFNKFTQKEKVENWQSALDALYEKGAILEIYKEFHLEHLYPVRN